MLDRVSLSLVNAMWRALRDGPEPARPNAMALFVDRFRDGDLVPRWAVLDLVGDLGLIRIAHVEDLLSAFDVGTVTGYPPPRARDRLVVGTSYVTLSDVVELLVMLERCGLPVDPAPLVAVLKPRLKGKAILSGADLRVWWFDQERHRSEGVTLTADGPKHVTAASARTPGGYKAEVWLTADGQAVSLWVRSPRYRHRRRAL